MAGADESMARVLRAARTIVVVGLSDKPERDSNEIARYLQRQGYRIVPVNPNVAEVLGERSYPSIDAIPADRSLDIVDLFRRGEEVEAPVRAALARGAKAVWMQLGVRNEAAARLARERGVPVFEDTCIMVQHRRLRIGPVGPATGPDPRENS